MEHAQEDSRQRLGEKFNLEKYLQARELTIKTINFCQNLIHPGMNEAEGISIVHNELKKVNVNKFWHPTKFRIGKNTTKKFSEQSEQVILEKEDIYFIDVGPILFDHEADFGQTFVLENNPQYLHLQKSAQLVFQKTANAFLEHKLNGKDLYRFAEEVARELNLEINLDMNGHRLGDFPHALFYKGSLSEFEKIPDKHLWVLEIHLIDHKIGRGAFFEDLLF